MEFIKKFPADFLLYRSGSTEDKMKNGNWFSFAPSATFGYGSFTGEFKTKKELKLIDITREDFYTEFIHYLNAYNVSEPDKCMCTFPIGFINFDCYKKYATSLGLTISSSISDDIERMSQFYGNRSRCSVHELDKRFTEMLKLFFKDHADGFIASSFLPNKLMNGKHHPELFLFETANVVFIQLIPQSGGTIVKIPELEHHMKDIVYPVHLDLSKIDPELKKVFLNSDYNKYSANNSRQLILKGGSKRKTLKRKRYT